jgi:hypothetical protein
MRLDTSLLTVLAALTGDSAFLNWRPRSLPVRVDSNVDVPQMVYEHAVICEYAHTRLRWLRDRTAEADRPHPVAAHPLYRTGAGSSRRL